MRMLGYKSEESILTLQSGTLHGKCQQFCCLRLMFATHFTLEQDADAILPDWRAPAGNLE